MEKDLILLIIHFKSFLYDSRIKAGWISQLFTHFPELKPLESCNSVLLQPRDEPRMLSIEGSCLTTSSRDAADLTTQWIKFIRNWIKTRVEKKQWSGERAMFSEWIGLLPEDRVERLNRQYVLIQESFSVRRVDYCPIKGMLMIKLISGWIIRIKLRILSSSNTIRNTINSFALY